MTLQELYHEASKVAFTAVYDMAVGTLCIRWRENYCDPDEAEFFGNQVKEGEVLGIAFIGVADIKTTLQDHVYLGSLESFLVTKNADDTRVAIGYVTESMSKETLAFRCSGFYVEVFAKGQIEKRRVEP
jgi:hypothetical protein